jgi:predicted anti-sigma-YlaC factor YlaD
MSMSCEDFHRFMAEYLDGELCGEQHEFFHAHIDRCPPCVEFLDTYKSTVDLAKRCECADEQESGKIPEGLVQAILATRKIRCCGSGPLDDGGSSEGD